MVVAGRNPAPTMSCAHPYAQAAACVQAQCGTSDVARERFGAERMAELRTEGLTIVADEVVRLASPDGAATELFEQRIEMGLRRTTREGRVEVALEGRDGGGGESEHPSPFADRWL